MILLTDINRTPLKGQGKLVKEEMKKKRISMMQFCRNNKMMDTYVQFGGWLNGKPNALQSYHFIDALKAEHIIVGIEIVKEGNK